MTYDPKNLSIGSVLDAYYAIPKFQRPYNWTSAQVEELMSDVFSDPESIGKDGYFLGSIVTIRKDPSTSTATEPFVLIDGQQRLTTLSLTLLVLLPLIEAETQGDAESRQERVVKARGRLRQRTKDGASGDHVNTPRITLQPQDAEVYEQLIQDPGAIDDEDLAGHLLVQAAKTIRSQVSVLLSEGPYSNDPIGASSMMDLLCERVSLVRINADTDTAAFRLFEAMNDRGLDLSAADLVKNKLLSRCREKDSTQVLKDWQTAIEKVGTEQFISFLRTYWIAAHGFVRKDKLYDAYKGYLGKLPPSEIKAFTKQLVKAAEFHRLFDAPKEHGKKDRDLAAILWRMKWYNAKSYRPAVLAARLNREADADFQLRVARLCESLIVRWSIVAKNSANTLEQLYADIAKLIRESKGKIGQLIPDDVVSTVPDDEKFRADFLAADTSAARQWQALLEALNYHLADNDAELHAWGTKGIHVEHVLPQQPDEDGLSGYGLSSQEEVEEWAYRPGNLTLLGGRRNRRISNGPFDLKVSEAYSKSDVYITRKIAEEYKKWGPKQITARSEKLADAALEVFSLRWNTSGAK